MHMLLSVCHNVNNRKYTWIGWVLYDGSWELNILWLLKVKIVQMDKTKK